MPKTFVDGKQVKGWLIDGRRVKRAYNSGRLCFNSAPSEVTLTLATDSYFDYTKKIDEAYIALAGDWAAGSNLKIIVPAFVEIVNHPAYNSVLYFDAKWGSRTIIIENYGRIIGRGGNGGSEGAWGKDGMTGIIRESGNVIVRNYGVIAGGGGGGGGNRLGDSAGGGGGRPYGTGGWGSYWGWAGNGTTDSPGAGGGNNLANPGAGQTRYGGNGGDWGKPGGNGIDFGSATTGGGAPGKASIGTITWEVLGSVYGVRA